MLYVLYIIIKITLQVVKFFQKNKKVTIEYDIKGLKDGKHGFHIR